MDITNHKIKPIPNNDEIKSIQEINLKSRNQENECSQEN